MPYAGYFITFLEEHYNRKLMRLHAWSIFLLPDGELLFTLKDSHSGFFRAQIMETPDRCEIVVVNGFQKLHALLKRAKDEFETNKEMHIRYVLEEAKGALNAI